MKRLISLCLVCLLLVSTAGTGVLAAEEVGSGLSSAQSGTDGRLEVPDAGISIELPEDMYIIYKGFLLEDPVLEEAGIEDPTQLKEEFNQYGTCMQLISKDRSINITINKKSSDSTQNIYNLGALDDAGFQQVLDSMKPSGPDTEKIDYKLEKYPHSDVPFFYMEVSVNSEQNGLNSQVSYGTIVNGYSIAINTYKNGGQVSDRAKALVKDITDSIVFSEVKPMPSVENVPDWLWYSIIGFTALIVVVGTCQVFYNRSMKRRRMELADRISQYRQEQLDDEKRRQEAGEPPQQLETLFLNVTEYTDDAIRKFTVFHYLRKKTSMPFIALCLSIICLAGFFSSYVEGLISFLLLLIGLALIGWIIWVPIKMTRNNLNSYRKAHIRINRYTFREENFRVGGMQAANASPYFQITSAYETRDFFYLYFGEEQAYYLNKNNFEQGDSIHFREFLKRKLGHGFHRF